jgi:hypothetical protein
VAQHDVGEAGIGSQGRENFPGHGRCGGDNTFAEAGADKETIGHEKRVDDHAGRRRGAGNGQGLLQHRLALQHAGRDGREAAGGKQGVAMGKQRGIGEAAPAVAMGGQNNGRG